MRRILRWAALLMLSVVALEASVSARAAGSKPPAVPALEAERVRFEPVTGDLSVAGGHAYRGSIEVVRSGSGLAVVNRVGFEDYLKGISEVPVSWPAEAQKAQAIAARTYALSDMLRDVPTATRAAGADICATDACQVYTGLAKERREGAEAWTKAVEATEGLVLLHKGEPIVAKYSSSNGGRSVAAGHPYLRSVEDPDDRHSPLHRWTSQLPLEPVRAALGVAGPIVRASRVGDTVAVVWEGESGAEETTFAAADFRSRIVRSVAAPEGLPQSLPSIRYSVYADPANGVLVAQGNGWGHGVGMSQWGAYGKALRGMKAPDILAAYYAGLRPVAVPVPPSIKVAVALDQAAVTVAGSGRFRVLDDKGQVLALAATGAWSLQPTATGIKVVPPAGAAGPVAVDGVRLEGQVRPGIASHLHFTVTEPAVVTITLVPPDGPDMVVARHETDGGAVAQPLPPLPAEGRWRAKIEADAGLLRRAATEVTFDVRSLRPGAVPAAQAFAGPQARPGLIAAVIGPDSGGSPVLVLVALLCLALVGGRLRDTLARVGWTGARPLH